jgi:hypothetical protein
MTMVKHFAEEVMQALIESQAIMRTGSKLGLITLRQSPLPQGAKVSHMFMIRTSQTSSLR